MKIKDSIARLTEDELEDWLSSTLYDTLEQRTDPDTAQARADRLASKYAAQLRRQGIRYDDIEGGEVNQHGYALSLKDGREVNSDIFSRGRPR